jgi:hypothetical protein
LGYPEQALQRSRAALTLARELSHAYSLVHALGCGGNKARKKKPDGCWRRSMAGSPKGLTPKTCKRRKRC